MITRVTLLPSHRCIVHTGHHKLEMHVRQALSQKKFARQYFEQTGECCAKKQGFYELMRKRFYAAGYDFNGRVC